MDLFAARNKNNLEERTASLKTYKGRVRRRSAVMLPDELLVWEILVRLPPKTLARFKCVCRAWRAIISSSPSFISAHLRQSASRDERGEPPSFLIAPHTLCASSLPRNLLSTDKVAFYHWQPEAAAGSSSSNARLVHTVDNLQGDSAGFAYCPRHCDGLVLLPTDTKLYVFNPGIGGHVFRLPEAVQTSCTGRGLAQAAGLGSPTLTRSLTTNAYKVAHFYRSVDYSERTYSAGMQVFTLGGSCWRTVEEDPPYPVMMPQETASFKGSLYWHIDRELLQAPLQGLLRLDLQEETFDFISYPVLPSDERSLQFAELGGKLCLVQNLPLPPREIMVFWTSVPSDDSDNHQWHRVYVIDNLPWPCTALRFLGDCVFLQSGARIYRHHKATGTTEEVASVDELRYKNPRTGSLDFVGKDRYFIFIVPYTESQGPAGQMTFRPLLLHST